METGNALERRQLAQAEMDAKTKPLGSLGHLETWGVHAMVRRHSLKPIIESGRILLFAADHGLADDGVSLFPKAVTREMLRNLDSGGAAINAICNATPGLSLAVVDVGVDTAETFSSVHMRKQLAPHGTLSSLTADTAMTPAQLDAALAAGAEFADAAVDAGVDAVGIGELGIGNTAVAAILLAAVSGKSAAEVTGRGTGVEGDKLAHKTSVVESVLAKHAAVIATQDWRAVFCAVGGLEIAAMAGAAAAVARHPARPALLVDGFISTVAFLMAIKLHPADAHLLHECAFLAHSSAERAAAAAVDEVNRAFKAEVADAAPLAPMLDLGMRLGEGTGAALGFAILRAAAHVAADMNTFAGAGVSGSE